MRLVESSNTVLLLNEMTSRGEGEETMRDVEDEVVNTSDTAPLFTFSSTLPHQRGIQGRVSHHYELVSR